VWCASVLLLCTSSPLNKSDYTDLSFAESVVFYSTAFPPVIRLARHRHRARRQVGGVPAGRRRRRSFGPSRSGGDSGGGTRKPLRRAAVWTSRPDCVNLGRYRVRKRMYNNNNNIISFSFHTIFVFLSIFPMSFSFISRTHSRWTRRVYDRSPDRVLESAEPPVVSLWHFRFVFFPANRTRRKIPTRLEPTQLVQRTDRYMYAWCSYIDEVCVLL